MASLEAIHADVQEHFHDQWDWLNAAFYVEAMRAHLAKLRADNKALLEALKAFMGLPHLFDDMCVDERPDCKVCAAIKLARAAIEHSEPQ